MGKLAFPVQMPFILCVTTGATIRHGTNSWRWTGFSVTLPLVVSFAVGIVIYQGAQLLGLGT